MEAAGVASSKKAICFSHLGQAKAMMVEAARKMKKIGEDDPRQIQHSLKVGLTLTLVSCLYYFEPLFNGFGVNAMWAVLTVVLVMEYTVGGTLSKGLNRSFATMAAGSLGLGAHYLAILSGEKGEPIVLGVFVFLLATAATFSRFVPEIKKRYDYGVMIFILTFSLVAMSSYRTEDVIKIVHQRLSTIAIGVACCLSISVFIFPVWAGEDLHEQAGGNLDKLASFLEGLGCNYLGYENEEIQKLVDKTFFGVYKSVLNSKAMEEASANFARWEPRHGRFSFRHPWSQYLKIGTLARQCACSMDALAAYLTNCPKIRIMNSEFRREIQAINVNMAFESSKALTEMASAIRTMTTPSPAKNHVALAVDAAGKTRAALSLSEEGVEVAPEILQSATVASLLIQVVGCVQEMLAAVDELARMAKYKASPEAVNKATVKPVADVECSHAIITVQEYY